MPWTWRECPLARRTVWSPESREYWEKEALSGNMCWVAPELRIIMKAPEASLAVIILVDPTRAVATTSIGWRREEV